MHQDSRRVVVVGTPEACARVQNELGTATPGHELLGAILLDATLPGALRSDAVLGDVRDLKAIHRDSPFDVALLCLSDATQRSGISADLRTLGVDVRHLPSARDVLLGPMASPGQVSLAEMDLAALVGRDSRRIDRTLVRSMIGGRRVLITGAGGSIGSEIARLCARFEPAELILMDRSDNALFEIDRQLASTAPDVERRVVLHDVVDLRSTAERFQALRPQVVFHAAAHKHVPLMEEHPAEALVNNFFGTRSVADASMRCGVDRFVMISTDKAVNPSSIMGATKQLAERYVRSCNGLSDTRFALVRFGNVLGSSCSVLPIWAKQISEGGPVTVTHPEMTRYFMTIPEAAALVVQSAGISIDDAASPDVFVLDMGEPVSILSLAQRLIGALGMVPSMGDDAVEGGMPIAISGIRPGEKLHEELVHAEESLDETRIPGIRAWTGECPSRADVEQMVRDMSAALGTGDAAAALGAIERYIPTISRSDSGVRESIPHPTAA